MAVSDEARHGRAKATPVSDNRVAGLRAPTATPAGTYVPTPQKTRMQFDDANFQESSVPHSGVTVGGRPV